MRHEVRTIEAGRNIEELSALKAQGYNVLIDLTAIDWLNKKTPRFEVIYRLMKLDAETGMDGGRIELRCAVDGDTAVLRTASSVYQIADWLEREVWDMFGVRFADRPGIQRLLMYESFVGHPLRKDYPIGKRQPLIGPQSGELPDSPSFNVVRPRTPFE